MTPTSGRTPVTKAMMGPNHQRSPGWAGGKRWYVPAETLGQSKTQTSLCGKTSEVKSARPTKHPFGHKEGNSSKSANYRDVLEMEKPKQQTQTDETRHNTVRN